MVAAVVVVVVFVWLCGGDVERGARAGARQREKGAAAFAFRCRALCGGLLVRARWCGCVWGVRLCACVLFVWCVEAVEDAPASPFSSSSLLLLLVEWTG